MKKYTNLAYFISGIFIGYIITSNIDLNDTKLKQIQTTTLNDSKKAQVIPEQHEINQAPLPQEYSTEVNHFTTQTTKADNQHVERTDAEDKQLAGSAEHHQQTYIPFADQNYDFEWAPVQEAILTDLFYSHEVLASFNPESIDCKEITCLIRIPSSAVTSFNYGVKIGQTLEELGYSDKAYSFSTVEKDGHYEVLLGRSKHSLDGWLDSKSIEQESN